MYNLLNDDVFVQLSRRPHRLYEECTVRGEMVVIDEIQKIPALLNEVHLLIEERGVRFLLTGSSARKLRRGGVNLLGGRALMRTLHPFSYHELGKHFDLPRALNHGLLPPVYFSASPDEMLEAYVGLYLKEEIASEGVTRNVPSFSRFLEVAGLSSGQIINYTKVANDAQVARSTVQNYYEILADTLVSFEVPPWQKSKKRKALTTSKYFLFDGGVARHLQNRAQFKPGSPEYGHAFEHYLAHELRTYSDYRSKLPLLYWRSTSGFEVDFLLGDKLAIEVKATKNVGPYDLKGLSALAEEGRFKNLAVVSFEAVKRKVGSITIYPWKDFLDELWDDRLI